MRASVSSESQPVHGDAGFTCQSKCLHARMHMSAILIDDVWPSRAVSEIHARFCSQCLGCMHRGSCGVLKISKLLPRHAKGLKRKDGQQGMCTAFFTADDK